MTAFPAEALPILTDADEILYRQVHPAWIRDGRVTSQAFRPTKKDEDRLSTARSSLTSAEGAFQLHTSGRELASAGSWGVTVGECNKQSLPCVPDPTTSPPEKVPDPAHCYVNFKGLESRGAIELAGAALTRHATARGCIYAPPAPH